MSAKEKTLPEVEEGTIPFSDSASLILAVGVGRDSVVSALAEQIRKVAALLRDPSLSPLGPRPRTPKVQSTPHGPRHLSSGSCR